MLDYVQIFRTNNDLKTSKKEKKKRRGWRKEDTNFRKERRWYLQAGKESLTKEAASGCWDFSLRVWKIKSLLAVFYYGVPFKEPNKTPL